MQQFGNVVERINLLLRYSCSDIDVEHDRLVRPMVIFVVLGVDICGHVRVFVYMSLIRWFHIKTCLNSIVILSVAYVSRSLLHLM